MRISIINPGGTSNFGERAIMVGTIYAIKDAYPNSQVAIYGYGSIKSEDRGVAQFLEQSGVKLFPQIVSGKGIFDKFVCIIRLLVQPQRSIGREAYLYLRNSHRVYAKGQESLTAAYGWKHLIDSVLEPLIVSRINRNIILYGHSIGPLYTHTQTLFAKYALRQIDRIEVRDSLSREVLKTLGYPSMKYTLVKDLAYVAMKNLPIARRQYARDHILVIPNAAIVKSSTEKDKYLSVLKSYIDEQQAKKEEVIVCSSVTASDWNNDYMLCSELIRLCPGTRIMRYEGLNEFLTAIKSSKLVISSRLHPIIMATGLETEILALSNAAKVKGLLNDLGLENRMREPFTIRAGG